VPSNQLSDESVSPIHNVIVASDLYKRTKLLPQNLGK